MGAEPRIMLDEPSREEWLAERRKAIAATDVAAILGISPWKSPIQVYCEKLGLVEETGETRLMRLGKAAEPAILREYELETGRRAALSSRLFRHAEAPLVGTPDAFEIAAPEDGIEIKTSLRADGWGEPGTDAVPDHYLVQVATYMALCDRDRWYVAALLGGSDFRVYEIRRDPELEALILETAARFWRDHIAAQVPPELDGSESARAIVAARHPRNEMPLRPATAEETTLVGQLLGARRDLDLAEALVSELETRLKDSIGEADGIEGPGFRATWKLAKGRASTDWKAVVSEAGVPAELVQRFTTTSPGSRRFLLNTKQEGSHA